MAPQSKGMLRHLEVENALKAEDLHVRERSSLQVQQIRHTQPKHSEQREQWDQVLRPGSSGVMQGKIKEDAVDIERVRACHKDLKRQITDSVRSQTRVVIDSAKGNKSATTALREPPGVYRKYCF